MPTPRYHGGAPLEHFPLNLPGFKGLNKQARGAILGPEWATRLENTVLDTVNRVAARKGWTNSTITTPAVGKFQQIIEHNNAGAMHLIGVADDSKVYKSTDNGAIWTNITGTATITDTNMQLVVFRDKVLGFQDGGTVVLYTGGTCSNLGAASDPAGGVATVAFGRIWAKDTATTVRYCALLNETDWTGSDAGVLDLTSVWPGQDEITALASFNGNLVVFSRRNIVIWSDGAGSALGIDPVQIMVRDTINGIGCVARDTVVNVKGDLWFLDDTGVHSLGRLISQKDNPLSNISANVQDELKGFVAASTTAAIRAVYSPQDRFYLLSLPAGTGVSETGRAFCFDTRGFLDDGAARCTGIWNQMVPTAMVVRDNLDLIIALRAKTGKVGLYSGYIDDLTRYVLEYESGWTNLDQNEIKILKRVDGLLYIQSATAVVFKWAFDFEDTFTNASVTYPSGGTAAEFGVSEFGIGQWGGGVAIQRKSVGGRGTGEYIKVGMTININSEAVSCQQITLYAKQGRLR